jgi:hypothetical protein
MRSKATLSFVVLTFGAVVFSVPAFAGHAGGGGGTSQGNSAPQSTFKPSSGGSTSGGKASTKSNYLKYDLKSVTISR